MQVPKLFQFNFDESFAHLPSAPIVEAVIHWFARTEKTPIPDDISKQLLELLPEYPDCKPQHELRFEAQIGPDGSSTQIRRDNGRGFRLTSADGLCIAQFSRDGIVFSRLKPYQSWEQFSAEAVRLWKIFLELAQPPEIQRLGVRFINRIPIAKPTDIGKFPSKAPRCLEKLKLPMSTFLFQSTYDVPGHPFRVNVIQTIQPAVPPQSDQSGLILDIDVSTTQSFQPNDEELKDRLGKMRWLKNKAFFELLKKSAIQSFEREMK